MSLIYLDNQATTAVDPRVLAVMLPFFTERYGNAGSVTHAAGEDAKDAVEQARAVVAQALGAHEREVVFTSGATESNNLALRGVWDRWSARGKHVVSVATEHKAVLDPLARLQRLGAEITWLDVRRHSEPDAGRIDLEQLRRALRPDTILVSIMWANNEIGTLQPMREIGEICREREVLLHSDATQAVGKVPVAWGDVGVDLLSLSAHKFHGPKGVGALLVRRRRPAIRLVPQLEGGGQEHGLRSGTLNVPGIVGLAEALRLATENLPEEFQRLRELRDELYNHLSAAVPGLVLRGPMLDDPGLRLPQNLNVGFPGMDGQALMLQTPEVAVSAGSACTAANPEPSHVLRALGLPDDQVQSSLRLAVSRFTTREEVQRAAELLGGAADRLTTWSRSGGDASAGG